jgi:hypothetical protein
MAGSDECDDDVHDVQDSDDDDGSGNSEAVLLMIMSIM